jgi:hypothetical protein
MCARMAGIRQDQCLMLVCMFHFRAPQHGCPPELSRDFEHARTHTVTAVKVRTSSSCSAASTKGTVCQNLGSIDEMDAVSSCALSARERGEKHPDTGNLAQDKVVLMSRSGRGGRGLSSTCVHNKNESSFVQECKSLCMRKKPLTRAFLRPLSDSQLLVCG